MSDKTLLAALLAERDQAQESVRAFIKAHFQDGDPDDSLMALLEQFATASNGTDPTAAIWGILAAYGTITGICEYLQAKVEA